jgi:hypothetical protein
MNPYLPFMPAVLLQFAAVLCFGFWKEDRDRHTLIIFLIYQAGAYILLIQAWVMT